MFSRQYKPHNIALPRFIPRAKTHTEIKTRKEKFSGGGGNYPFLVIQKSAHLRKNYSPDHPFPFNLIGFQSGFNDQ